LRRVLTLLFFYIIINEKGNQMNKAKLKVLVRALKEIVDELESEIYSDPEAYTDNDFSSPDVSYDEVFEDDDG
jgi:hypothetical protein